MSISARFKSYRFRSTPLSITCVHIAGCQGQIFSDSFLSGVYDRTKGVARKIINVCRNALLLGVTEQKQIPDETDLKRVLLVLEDQIC